MMKMTLIIRLSLVWLSALILSSGCERNNNLWQLYSPDREIRLDVNYEPSSSGGRLTYTTFLKINGDFRQITEPSALGLQREDGNFMDGLVPVEEEFQQGLKEQYTLVTGKQLECETSYNMLTLGCRNATDQKIDFVFRAYDGGVAFRYHFPESQEGYLRIVREYSSFNFMDGSFWGHPYDSITPWTPAYETYYQGPVAIGTPAPSGKNGWAFPILLETQGAWILVSESGLDGTYGASHLEPDCAGGEYSIRFAEPGEAVGYYENTAYSTLPWSTPWRFMAIGSSPDAIVETNMATHLAEPSRIADPSWIEPGRATWSWWSDSGSPQEFDRLVPFINFAADMGWEYSLVDANWNHMKGGEIGTLAKVADEKGVGLLLWYNSGGKHNTVTEEPRDRMDARTARRAEFEKISSLGIRGIKVDFFQSDKQEIIRQYLEILEDAAEFHLLVNFHGCTLPKGWRRTWPNLVSMEAVRGGESYKFDGQFPEKAPAHLAIVPYTRNAVGPVDYTPGGFSDQTHPHLTTPGFELALPVILESGIMHYTDTPEKTASMPGQVVAFLKEIPVTWDETRFIAGYPGKEAVIARKKGDRWYLAGINGEPVSKTLTLDLTPTGSEPAQIQLLTDGDIPDTLVEESTGVSGGKITVQLLPYGGFAAFWD